MFSENGSFFFQKTVSFFYTNHFEMKLEILLSTIFANWVRHFNIFLEKATHIIENLSKKFGI